MRASVLVAFAACGRLDFDPIGTSDGSAGGDASGSTATSCVGLASTCGPTGTGSCCDSPLVPGGTFSRSYDVATDGMWNDPSNTATVSDFRLDKYEVTVGRFRQFVLAGTGTQANPPAPGAGANPNTPGTGWDSSWNAHLVADQGALLAAIACDQNYPVWTATPGGDESRPMNCQSWYEAMAFCAWDGGFLPTEAEWNYAAAGGSEQRAYPWSSPPGSLTIDTTDASFYVDATEQCFGDGVDGCSVGDMLPVGSLPAGDGKWGQSDLAGNVWEEVYDWGNPYSSPCDDCVSLTPSVDHQIRGGSFDNVNSALRTSYRYSCNATDERCGTLGFRCARAP